MDTLLGIVVVGVWIAISVVALKRAFGGQDRRQDVLPSDSNCR